MSKTERFLKIVEGLSYLTDDVKAARIKNVLESLSRVHNGFDNFYAEPPYANELKSMVGDFNIPESIEKDYVLTLTEVFLTNGNGLCRAGDLIYKELINKFNENQSYIALLSFTKIHLQNKLLNSLCQDKFKELINLIDGKITDILYKSITKIILSENISLNKLQEDSRIKEKLNFINKQNNLNFAVQ